MHIEDNKRIVETQLLLFVSELVGGKAYGKGKGSGIGEYTDWSITQWYIQKTIDLLF